MEGCVRDKYCNTILAYCKTFCPRRVEQTLVREVKQLCMYTKHVKEETNPKVVRCYRHLGLGHDVTNFAK